MKRFIKKPVCSLFFTIFLYVENNVIKRYYNRLVTVYNIEIQVTSISLNDDNNNNKLRVTIINRSSTRVSIAVLITFYYIVQRLWRSRFEYAASPKQRPLAAWHAVIKIQSLLHNWLIKIKGKPLSYNNVTSGKIRPVKFKIHK